MYSLNDESFERIALKIFRFQATENLIYRRYLESLGVDPQGIANVTSIPFLPISFFKSHLLQSGAWEPAVIYRSSGTTGIQTSRHAVADPEAYLTHARHHFERMFGQLSAYHILPLLPSYLERPDSSLVAMVSHFVSQSCDPDTSFYTTNYQELIAALDRIPHDRKVLIWGVTFALLELSKYKLDRREHMMVIETGGMKGRGKEITRTELHNQLTDAFGLDTIYSEYGMTELLSQAYTRGGDLFYPANTMRVFVRDIYDPFNVTTQGSGALNIVDLANFRTVSFIETEDIVAVRSDGSFEVRGRLDTSDVRGCNLLIE